MSPQSAKTKESGSVPLGQHCVCVPNQLHVSKDVEALCSEDSSLGEVQPGEGKQGGCPGQESWSRALLDTQDRESPCLSLGTESDNQIP